MQPTPDFEAEIRLAMAVPEPDPAFLSSLRRQVSRPRSTRAIRFAWAGLAVSAIFLLAIIWIVGPQTVFAEFRSLFGYIPGVGLVQNDASLRILAEPVKIERDGITVQVLEGAADPSAYRAGFPSGWHPSERPTYQRKLAGCAAPFTLQAADGSQCDHRRGWQWLGDGLQRAPPSRPCLPGAAQAPWSFPASMDTRPGSAPENWQIPCGLSRRLRT